MDEQQLDSLFGSDDEIDTLESLSVEGSKASKFVTYSTMKTMPDVGGGRGLFATCDLKPGSLILAEKPFVTWGKYADFSEVDDLATAILQILRSPAAVSCTQQLYPYTIRDCDISECNEIRKLFESYDDKDLVKLSAAGGCSILEAIRISLVLQHNGFGSGLYERQCLLNHSCLPNCLKLVPASKNGCSEIWTIREVQKDEELTICYVNPLESATTAVREYLRTNHRFTCNCSLCQSLKFSQSVALTEELVDSVFVDQTSERVRALLTTEETLEKKLTEFEAVLADHNGDGRREDLMLDVQELLAPFAAMSAAKRPVRLLARATKAGIWAAVKAIEALEVSGKPVRDTLAVRFLDFNLTLLSYQMAYLSPSHPDIGATLDSIADGILSLKQQFPKVFAEKFAARDWSAVVRGFSTATTSASVSAAAVTATQCAKLCKAEAKRIKALYSTALHYPDALKLFTAPPGSFYWGGATVTI